MAKRRAEPLVCHVPVKRPLREPPPSRAGERRARAEPERAEPGRAGPAATKRPLEEAEAPPGKRLGPDGPRAEPGDAGLRRCGGTAAAQDAAVAEGRAGGRGKERAAAAAEQEEFCQYNSFVYWRAPLPPIDLSDIRNLDEETPSDAKTAARTDATETEMET